MLPEIRDITSFFDVRELVVIHNAVWRRSTGIIDLLAESDACFISVDPPSKQVTGYAFIAIDAARNSVELNDIAIAPHYRRNGHGGALIRHIMSHHREIRLCADARRKKLIRFYQGHGFKTDSVYENYYGIGRDALRLVWRAEA